MLILVLLGMYFDAAVVFVTKSTFFQIDFVKEDQKKS